MNEENKIKIILSGESGVGCQQLSNISTYKEFKANSPSPVCWFYQTKKITINDKNFVINLWNGPGQEIFSSISKIYMKGADIVIFVYSIVDRSSFEKLMFHINTAFEILGNDFKGAIVGNKCDLYENEEVKAEEGEELAKKYGFKFALSSAKESKGFNYFLEELIKEFLLQKKLINIKDIEIIKERKERERIERLESKKKEIERIERNERERKEREELERERERRKQKMKIKIYEKLEFLKYYNK